MPLATEVMQSAEEGRESDELLKSILTAVNEANELRPDEPRAAIIDPYNVLEHVGTRSKRSPISFQILRNIALRAKPVMAIIQTRQNQVAKYLVRPEWDGGAGFRIRLKDADAKPTAAQKKRMLEVEGFLLKTHWPDAKLRDIAGYHRHDDLDTFVRKIVRDRLTLDAVATEHVPALDKRRGLGEFLAVDAATIEMANPSVYQAIHYPEDNGRICYVQKVYGRVEAEYTPDRLKYYIANPRTDVMHTEYGLSELEMLVETVTSHLFAEDYNKRYFTQNNLPQGVLSVIGKYRQSNFDAFKRAWTAMVSGVANSWKVPMLAMEEGQGLQFTPFKQSNRDMEYFQWLEYLTVITAAIYQIDPTEIGFRAFGGGSGGGMAGGGADSNATATRIAESKDKGLEPLLRFVEKILTEVVERIDDEFCFKFTGVSEEDVERKLARQKSLIESGIRVVAEIRAENDYGDLPQPNDGTEVDTTWQYKPLNQIAASYINQAEQLKAQEQQGQTQHEQGMAGKNLDHQHGMEQGDADHQRQLTLAEKQAQLGMSQAELGHQHKLTESEQQAKLAQQATVQQQGHERGMREYDHKATAAEAERGHQYEMQKTERQAELAQAQAEQQGKQAADADQRKAGVDAEADKRKAGIAAEADDRKAKHAAEADERKATYDEAADERKHKYTTEDTAESRRHERFMWEQNRKAETEDGERRKVGHKKPIRKSLNGEDVLEIRLPDTPDPYGERD